MIKCAKGSSTIEAALILPMICVVIIVFISWSQQNYIHFATKFEATRAAERVAFSWDDISRDPISGLREPEADYPSLYWRWTDDHRPLGWPFRESDQAAYILPLTQVDEEANFSKLVQQKLIRLRHSLPSYEGYAAMQHRGWQREVFVQLQTSAHDPITIRSISWEPGTWLRFVKFSSQFLERFISLLSPQQATEQFDDYPLRQEEPNFTVQTFAFTREQAASEWLRTHVNGERRTFPTGHTGSWRLIDALDPQGIGHEAKLGHIYYREQIRDQLAKDIELREHHPEVTGIVWHFFERQREEQGFRGYDYAGGSQSLLDALRDAGIVTVIYEATPRNGAF